MKTILITGATDGIGLETATRLAEAGHRVLLHGRSAAKLEAIRKVIPAAAGAYLADLSKLADVVAMAKAVSTDHDHIDVLINNAGVLKTSTPISPSGLDVRFMVNTVAPYVLTRRLLPLLSRDGRIINLSSAAQAPIDPAAFAGERRLHQDMDAYSQSKLAITLWSRVMGEELSEGPLVVAVNPGSLLATKMVKEGFGIDGNDIGIGAEILVNAALSDEFDGRTGQYYDNDSGRFAAPHPIAMDAQTTAQTMKILEALAAAAPA